MTRKIYDAWLKCDNEVTMIEAGQKLISSIMNAGFSYGWDFNFRKFEFVGAAARVQIECWDGMLEMLKEKTGYNWTETKPLP